MSIYHKSFLLLIPKYGESPATTYYWLRTKNQPAWFAMMQARLQHRTHGKLAGLSITPYRRARL